MSPIRRLHARLLAILAALSLGAAVAASTCGALVGGYFDAAGGTVVPCLVDLQEAGLCFRLPGTTLDAATRTLDAHLQAQGVPRPQWTTRAGTDATRFDAGGERIELVVSSDGPFDVNGICRIVPAR